MLSVAATVLLAWGVLAFGAVYPWAYWPLLVGASFVGTSSLWFAPSKTVWRDATPHSAAKARMDDWFPPGVIIGLSAASLGTVAQLVPLPSGVLSRVSPATVELLNELGVSSAVAQIAAHPLSVRPEATAVTLAFLIVLTLFLVGLTRAFSTTGTRSIAAGICILGVVVAFTGIVQRTIISTDKIYGFWTPRFARSFYAPFVNRNHFAGWMIMAMPVALGYFAGRLARAMRDVKPGWREKVLWWSSPAANQLVLVAVAILVMGVSLLMSLSRSGVICALLAFVLTGQMIARKQPGTVRKVAGLGYLTFVVVAIAGWVGTDAIAKRFAATEWAATEGRLGAWADGLDVLGRFWPTGTGMNTYGDAMLVHQKYDPTVHYLQAHNDYLQVAAEGGVLVALPALITIGFFVRHVRRRLREDPSESMSYWVRAGACTGLVAIALQETVDFSLQMPANAALFCVLAAIAMHRAPVSHPCDRLRSRGDGQNEGDRL